jgi:hypothetical protein
MADIFISYKKEDAGRVIRIVEALREEGFSVWWDHGITPGAQWDQTIHTELNAAKVVIAVWSAESVTAPWVKEEANVGKNRGILLPIRIDDVEPPLGFSLIQMGDLVGWGGGRDDPHWRQVLGAIKAIISGERPVGLERAPRRRRAPLLWIGAIVALLVVGGLAAALYLAQSISSITYTRPGDDISDPTASTVTIERHGARAPNDGASSAQEEAAWQAALQSRARNDFQSYLLAFPNGAHAQQARDALLLCRTETRETWREQRVGQVIRGVSSPLPTQAAACDAARQVARANGERACRAIASNDGYRNGRPSFVESACECTQTPGGTFCITDPGYTCAFEQRVQEPTEICG